MRDNTSGSGADGDAADSENIKKRKKRKASARNAGGFGRGQGFGQGFGQAFGGGFGPNQFLQLLPLLMAMGGGMRGGGVGNLQLQLMMWMIETWLDYLAAMQEVFERALDRLRDMDVCGGLMGGAVDGDDDGKEW